MQGTTLGSRKNLLHEPALTFQYNNILLRPEDALTQVRGIYQIARYNIDKAIEISPDPAYLFLRLNF